MANVTHRMDEPSRKHQGDAAPVYYTVFALLFVISFFVFALMKLFGQPVDGGLIAASKRAAHGPAGYAVKF